MPVMQLSMQHIIRIIVLDCFVAVRFQLVETLLADDHNQVVGTPVEL